MKILKKQKQSGPELGTIETLLGPGSTFEGNLKTNGSVCVEGTLRGHMTCGGAVIINNGAQVDGDVTAVHVVVHGLVTGNVTAQQQLDICSTGRIKGDVEAEVVTIARGGFLDGLCKMLPPPVSTGNVTALRPHSEVSLAQPLPAGLFTEE